MTTLGKCPERGSVYVWKFENFSHCTIPKGKNILSPVFENQHGSCWKLIFYPRGKDDNFVECMLKNEKSETFKIECHFCFCTLKHKVLYVNEISDRCISDHSFSSVAKFERNILENLQEDVLIMHCHILRVQERSRYWLSQDSDQSENKVRCFTPTRFGVQRIIFQWKTDNFNSLTLGEKREYRPPSVSGSTSCVTLVLSLDGWNVENASVQIWLNYINVKQQTFSTFTLCVKDGYGRTRKNIQEEYWLSLDESPKCFTLHRRDLISGGSLKNTLILSGEVTFSGDSEDVVVCGLEQGDAIAVATGISSQTLSLAPSPEMLPLLNGQGPPSDFELRAAGGRSFPVHQLVLWSRSSVFRAMLDVDMLEKSERRVDLEDVDADTAERMLVYAYTGAEPSAGLACESLVDLYSAADKYAFMGLKDMCAERLVQVLDPVNAPSVLQIADRHGDSNLKDKVMEFIYSKGQVAIESVHWKKLERDDPQLALEILHKIICDKFLPMPDAKAAE